MLYAQGRDPEVVFRNGLALLFEVESKPRLHFGGHIRNVQHAAAGYQPLYLPSLPRLANDGYW